MIEPDYIEVDEKEMADFISHELLKQGIIVKTEDILNVLALEVEFLKTKGVIIDDQRDLS